MSSASSIPQNTPVPSDSSVDDSSGISTTPALLSESDSDDNVESCPDSPQLSDNISMPRPNYAPNYKGHILSTMNNLTSTSMDLLAGANPFQPIVNPPEMYNSTVPDENLLPGIEHWDPTFLKEFFEFFVNGDPFSPYSSEQPFFFDYPETTTADIANLTSGFDCNTSSDLLSSPSTTQGAYSMAALPTGCDKTFCSLLWSSSCPCLLTGSVDWDVIFGISESNQILPAAIPEDMEEIDVPVEMNRLNNGKEIWIEPIRTISTPNVMGVPMQDCETWGMAEPWKFVKLRSDQWRVDEFGNRKLPLKITWPGYSSCEYLLDIKDRPTIADLASQIASRYKEAIQTLTTVTCPTNPWHLQSDWITFENLRLVGLFEVEGGFQAKVTILRPRALGDINSASQIES